MLTKNHISSSNTIPSPPPPTHKNSHTISKPKPNIRIIHVFTPEIIKTDPTNFRELVQRLTGKPTSTDLSGGGGGAAKTRARIVSRKKERVFASSKKMEVAMRAGWFRERERIKGEEEIWSGANSGGGFLGGFAEFDGFMQELNQFPLLEGADVYGLSQLA